MGCCVQSDLVWVVDDDVSVSDSRHAHYQCKLDDSQMLQLMSHIQA